jgi:membrane protein insertase Oxa1/YidC/SpoIIIJ
LYWLTSTTFTIVQQAIIMRELPVEKAKAEAVADWNAANPTDPVDAKATSKKGTLGKSASGKKTTKGGTSVTVRKRGDK